MNKLVILCLAFLFGCNYSSNRIELFEEVRQNIVINQSNWEFVITEMEKIEVDSASSFRLMFSPKRKTPKYSLYDGSYYKSQMPKFNFDTDFNSKGLKCNVIHAYSINGGFRFELSEPILKNFKTYLYFFNDENAVNTEDSFNKIRDRWYVELVPL